MRDDGDVILFIFAVDDGRALVLFQKIPHENGAVHPPQRVMVEFIKRQLRRSDARAAEPRVQQDHVAKAKLLPRRLDLLPQRRHYHHVRDDKVGDAEFRDRLVKFRIERPGRDNGHRAAQGERQMHLVDQAVDIAQIYDQATHRRFHQGRQLLQLCQAGNRRVKRPVREHDRLPHAAGRAGGVQDEGGVAAVPGGKISGLFPIGAQKRIHADGRAPAFCVPVLSLLRSPQHGVHRAAAHGHMQIDHISQPELLPAHKQGAEQIRLCKIIGEDKVCQLLIPDGLHDPVRIEGAVGAMTETAAPVMFSP